MTDIAAFLTARLDEDKTAAETSRDATPVEARYASGADFGPAVSRMLFHQRFNADRVLREVATKQTLIRIYQCAVTELGNHRKAAERASLLGDRGTEAFTAEVHRAEAAEREWRDVLQIHAAVYADHPDYDPAWRTE